MYHAYALKNYCKYASYPPIFSSDIFVIPNKIQQAFICMYL